MDKLKKILIVEDSKMNRRMLVDTLQDSYQLVEAENGEIAWNILQADGDTIDMVLSDIVMPVMDGFELLNRIKHNSKLRRIPIIVVTSLNETENEIRALDLGALEVIVKPYDPAIVQRRIKNVIQLNDLERMKAEYQLLKESQQLFDVFIDTALPNSNLSVWKYDIARDCITNIVSDKKHGFTRDMSNVSKTFADERYIHIDSLEDARDMFEEIRAGKKVVEKSIRVRKAGTLGLAKEDYWWNRIVHTTIYDDDGKAISAIGISEDITSEKQAKEKAEKDQLTKIYNRSGFIDIVDKKLIENKRKDTIWALIMIDLDNFKSVNDNFGHEYGDNVLIEVANRLRSVFRTEDCISRLGGDEFAVFISEISDRNAITERAEMVRTKLTMDFQLKYELIKLTCSIGVAVGPEYGSDFHTLYINADEALYQAKNS